MIAQKFLMLFQNKIEFSQPPSHNSTNQMWVREELFKSWVRMFWIMILVQKTFRPPFVTFRTAVMNWIFSWAFQKRNNNETGLSHELSRSGIRMNWTFSRAFQKRNYNELVCLMSFPEAELEWTGLSHEISRSGRFERKRRARECAVGYWRDLLSRGLLELIQRRSQQTSTGTPPRNRYREHKPYQLQTLIKHRIY